MPTTTIKPPKVYVAVKAEFDEHGTMFPRIITWEDGKQYKIAFKKKKDFKFIYDYLINR